MYRTHAEAKNAGWHSRRHETREAQDAARELYQATRGPEARRRRAGLRLRAAPTPAEEPLLEGEPKARPLTPWKRCEPTGKRGFASEAAAKAACRSVHNRIRTYRCPHCHDWHVTSEVQPARKRERRPRLEDAA